MKTTYLKEYQQLKFEIQNIDLEFLILESEVFVTAVCNFINNKEDQIILNGDGLELKEIYINDKKLENTAYEVKQNSLVLFKMPKDFSLKTIVKIDPFSNKSGEGLYKSGDILCTQCEAEGFRKISYYPDRPDCLSRFTTKIIADKDQYPYLLSNGNILEQGELDKNQHFVKWEDPFKKASYLFALVAGDFGHRSSTFKTMSNREILLEIYVDKGNEDKCDFALESLINSMKWEEQRFNLEYDLDRYMIVAVDSFNMGAMENKGLNIFNSAYVLAKKETATDDNFKGVEAVIGHEYFHNWTGNRVTCRDWFQLTLKEGLTVFRDQEFSSDLGSRPVKRIQDVRTLWQHQFAEDSSALSHPIKPKEYSEINNFYTATVYEKGAEVIRMVHTLIGEDKFQKGMKLYFERFDGQAVTTEDFISAMSDASGMDFEQFKVWYDQNGTPEVEINESYENEEYKVVFKQTANLNNDKFNALHIPFYFNLYDKSGNLIDTFQYELKEKEQVFKLKVANRPYPSWNIDYCAPVKIKYEYSDEHLSFLSTYEKDSFARYMGFQNLVKSQLFKIESSILSNENPKIEKSFVDSFNKILTDLNIDNHFKSYILSVPSLNELNNSFKEFRFDSLEKAIKFLKDELKKEFKGEFSNQIKTLNNLLKTYSFDEASIGNRALRSLFLDYTQDLEQTQKLYNSADNMTDSSSFLSLLVRHDYNASKTQQAVDDFYKKWNHEPLVIQKWFSILASSKDITIQAMNDLAQNKAFRPDVPNDLRSLYGAFARNFTVFNKEDGSGYRYIKDKVIEIDKYNPQVASRLCKFFSQKSKLDKNRKQFLIEVLKELSQKDLSADVTEIVELSLK